MKNIEVIDNEMLNIYKMVAPGTVLREGLENIIKAKTGALIVISDSEEVLKIADGGFKLEQDFTPATIYELSKMDGAIIISKDLKKILRANVQLVPDHLIKTVETGTRHRTAERTAKQTNELVICISQRRGVITVFKGNIRYVISDTASVMTRANQTLQVLEKDKVVLDNMLNVLSEHEFDDIVSLDTVASSIYRSEIIMRMQPEVVRNMAELGDEGSLINSQFEEIMNNVEDEELKIIKDYMKTSKKKPEKILEDIRNLDKKDLLIPEKIVKILGYNTEPDIWDKTISSRGYRIVSKIPKMPNAVIDKLIQKFDTLQGICSASIEELDEVEGIGEIRAKIINQTLRRLQEQYVLKGYDF